MMLALGTSTPTSTTDVHIFLCLQLSALRASVATAEQQRTQLLAKLRASVAPAPDLQIVLGPGHALDNERALEEALNTRKTVRFL
jgi:hypothetical protein